MRLTTAEEAARWASSGENYMSVTGYGKVQAYKVTFAVTPAPQTVATLVEFRNSGTMLGYIKGWNHDGWKAISDDETRIAFENVWQGKKSKDVQVEQWRRSELSEDWLPVGGV